MDNTRVLLMPTLDAGRALATIEREEVTAMMGVPPTHQFISRHPAFATTNLSSLHTVLSGGASLESPVRDAWAERGLRLTLRYGLTEAGPNVLCEPPGTAGSGAGMMPYPGVRACLRDPTARLIRGGWLATGDLTEVLPLTGSGKIDRRALRAAAEERS